jgi:hypothetical protein
LGFFGAISRMLRLTGEERNAANDQPRVLRYIQDYMALNGSVPPLAHLRDELSIPIPELRVDLEDIVRQWTLMSALDRTTAAPPPDPVIESASIADLGMDSIHSQLLVAPSTTEAPSGSPAGTVSVELSAEVFFNARHALHEEWDGETHAHTWKVLVVATSNQLLESGGLTAEKLRVAIQAVVARYEGADLNFIDDMAGLPATLERMAVQVDRGVRRQVVHRGGAVMRWGT